MSETFNKQDLSEQDIITKFVLPALERAGWDIALQVRQELSLTAGRIQVQGSVVSRDTPKRADIVLYRKPGIPVAVIEAKDNKHSVADGLQQALGYSKMLQVPFAFSTNGDAFEFHDETLSSGELQRTLNLDQFPSPDELWSHYCTHTGLDTPEKSQLCEQDYFDDASGKTPRYYQLNAINNTLEAVAKGNKRVLLVMATGTGKTYTAFQIIWRLWKARSVKRVLFLADRNILVDQTKTNDFKPFKGAMTKITKRTIDKSYEIYLALYQAISGTEEADNIYKEFSSDFFDLIVIDECHRGSAKEDSTWRDILTHFSDAIHLGLTATPKETKYVSNINYFGEPVYTYSLKEGIQDGFLAPYKVLRVDLDKDLQGWRPTSGQVDDRGNLIEDREYNQKDMDRNLVLEQRTKLVAKRVTDFIAKTDPYQKSIFFCEDIDHAERMRKALVNANPTYCAEDSKYVMQITGDNEIGKAHLDDFIHPGKKYPVLVTTSKLLTTGVDAQTCKIIVIDQTINSMTEFKQIIGRGTRIKEEYGKQYFTIIDFRNATKLFADPDFDGDPIPDDNFGNGGDGPGGDGPGGDGPGGEGPGGEGPGGEGPGGEGPGGDGGKRIKYHVGDVEVTVLAERIQYLDADGNLITESLKDYTRKNVTKEFASLDDFLIRWTKAERKEVVVDELQEKGVLIEALKEEVGKDYDAFDLICHVAYDQPPLTRRERANNVRKRNYFTKYGEQARAVLDALLNKYSDEGLRELESLEVLKINPFTEIGSPFQIISQFGSKEAYLEAVRELQQEIYKAA